VRIRWRGDAFIGRYLAKAISTGSNIPVSQLLWSSVCDTRHCGVTGESGSMRVRRCWCLLDVTSPGCVAECKLFDVEVCCGCELLCGGILSYCWNYKVCYCLLWCVLDVAGWGNFAYVCSGQTTQQDDINTERRLEARTAVITEKLLMHIYIYFGYQRICLAASFSINFQPSSSSSSSW
jgi:hypothetical protein